MSEKPDADEVELDELEDESEVNSSSNAPSVMTGIFQDFEPVQTSLQDGKAKQQQRAQRRKAQEGNLKAKRQEMDRAVVRVDTHIITQGLIEGFRLPIQSNVIPTWSVKPSSSNTLWT